MAEDYGLPTRYEDFVSLGDGAFGSVYKVTDSQSKSIVALKIIRSTDPALAETLENEFSTLSTLSHGNLIGVNDYGRSETGQPYFTMDFINGPHLAKFLNPKSNAIHTENILMCILSALEYLSARNIVHGDIKPENILLSDNTSTVPILVDFGLSTLSNSEQGKIFGTPRFLAPEILHNRVYSQKSDLYALGHTLIECLRSIKTPLSVDISEGYFQDVSADLNQIFSETGIPYPRNLTSFILKLANPDPTKRPDTTTLAIQQLANISSTLADDRITLGSVHIARDNIDELLEKIIQDCGSRKQVILLEGASGSGKKALMSHMLNQAQLANYSVLNFIDIPPGYFSLQTIIDILSINLIPSESAQLLEQHYSLLNILKRAEATSDLDNLGVIYSNIVKYILRLSNKHPILILIPNIERIGSDALKFLSHLINEIEFTDATILLVLSHASDVPSDTELDAQISNLSKNAYQQDVPGFNFNELKNLCTELFQPDIFTNDEIKRILTQTNGLPQIVFDYFYLLINENVIARSGNMYFVDHKLLSRDYSSSRQDDIAKTVVAQLNEDESFFLYLLSSYNAPIKLSRIESSLKIDLGEVVSICDKKNLIVSQGDTVSIRSPFLLSELEIRTSIDTRITTNRVLAEYCLLEEPDNFARIAEHFIKANMPDKALEYGVRAVKKHISAHEYYSAYRILLALKELLGAQRRDTTAIDIFETLASLEVTLGYIDDSIQNYETLIELSSESSSISRYFNQLGEIEHYFKGNTPIATDYYNNALASAKAHSDHEVESSTLIAMGIALNDVSYIDKAAVIAKHEFPKQYIHALSKALYLHTIKGNTDNCHSIIQELDMFLPNEDSELLADIYYSKSINAFYTGDYITANNLLEELIHIAEKDCDEIRRIRYMSALAGIHYVQGQFHQQIKVLQKAYYLVTKYQIYSYLITILSNIALAQFALAEYSKSLSRIKECWEAFHKYSISEIPSYYFSIGARAHLIFGKEYSDDFNGYIADLEKSAQESQKTLSLGQRDIIQGDLFFYMGDFNNSIKQYVKALSIFQDAHAKDDSLESLLKLSLAHRLISENETARDYAKQAAKIFREINCGYLKPLYSYVAALSEVHDNPDSLAPMLEAIDTSKAFGTREWTWQIQFHLARLYKEAGDISNSVKYCRESINTLKEITESFDNPEQISSYLQVPLRSQVFDFVKSLRP